MSARAFFTAAVGALALSCTSTEPAPAPAPPSSSAPLPPPPAPSANAAPRRALVAGALFPGRPENLLLDPGFAGAEVGQQNVGSFLGLYSKDFTTYVIGTRVDSASPARLGGAVAILRDPKGTETSAKSVELIGRFNGGKGPFVAELWVASLDPSGAPRPLPDDTSFTASLTCPAESIAVDLARDPGPPRQGGARAWTRYAARLERDLVGGGLLFARSGTRPGGFEIAAPVVLAAPTLPAGTPFSAPARAPRPLTPGERATIAAALAR